MLEFFFRDSPRQTGSQTPRAINRRSVTGSSAAIPHNSRGDPGCDFALEFLDFSSEDELRVCSSQQFILGAEVEEFEREIATFIGVPSAVGCASGTDALWLTLVAAGVQPGDGVITTAFSFFASASAIVRVGARPVLVDIDPRTFNLDPEKVAARLRSGGSHKIRALLPVHLYGQCADMDALQHLSEEFDLVIIEDAAQAIGAKCRGHQAGSLGIAAAFK